MSTGCTSKVLDSWGATALSAGAFETENQNLSVTEQGIRKCQVRKYRTYCFGEVHWGSCGTKWPRDKRYRAEYVFCVSCATAWSHRTVRVRRPEHEKTRLDSRDSSLTEDDGSRTRSSGSTHTAETKGRGRLEEWPLASSRVPADVARTRRRSMRARQAVGQAPVLGKHQNLARRQRCATAGSRRRSPDSGGMEDMTATEPRRARANTAEGSEMLRWKSGRGPARHGTEAFAARQLQSRALPPPPCPSRLRSWTGGFDSRRKRLFWVPLVVKHCQISNAEQVSSHVGTPLFSTFCFSPLFIRAVDESPRPTLSILRIQDSGRTRPFQVVNIVDA